MKESAGTMPSLTLSLAFLLALSLAESNKTASFCLPGHASFSFLNSSRSISCISCVPQKGMQYYQTKGLLVRMSRFQYLLLNKS